MEDSRNKIITASGQEISYDKLLIASGASPLKAAKDVLGDNYSPANLVA